MYAGTPPYPVDEDLHSETSSDLEDEDLYSGTPPYPMDEDLNSRTPPYPEDGDLYDGEPWYPSAEEYYARNVDLREYLENVYRVPDGETPSESENYAAGSQTPYSDEGFENNAEKPQYSTSEEPDKTNPKSSRYPTSEELYQGNPELEAYLKGFSPSTGWYDFESVYSEDRRPPKYPNLRPLTITRTKTKTRTQAGIMTFHQTTPITYVMLPTSEPEPNPGPKLRVVKIGPPGSNGFNRTFIPDQFVPEHSCPRDAMVALAHWRDYCGDWDVMDAFYPRACAGKKPSVENCCGQWVSVDDSRFLDYETVRYWEESPVPEHSDGNTGSKATKSVMIDPWVMVPKGGRPSRTRKSPWANSPYQAGKIIPQEETLAMIGKVRVTGELPPDPQDREFLLEYLQDVSAGKLPYDHKIVVALEGYDTIADVPGPGTGSSEPNSVIPNVRTGPLPAKPGIPPILGNPIAPPRPGKLPPQSERSHRPALPVMPGIPAPPYMNRVIPPQPPKPDKLHLWRNLGIKHRYAKNAKNWLKALLTGSKIPYYIDAKELKSRVNAWLEDVPMEGEEGVLAAPPPKANKFKEILSQLYPKTFVKDVKATKNLEIEKKESGAKPRILKTRDTKSNDEAKANGDHTAMDDLNNNDKPETNSDLKATSSLKADSDINTDINTGNDPTTGDNSDREKTQNTSGNGRDPKTLNPSILRENAPQTGKSQTQSGWKLKVYHNEKGEVEQRQVRKNSCNVMEP